MSKIYTKDEIGTLLMNNDKAIGRALNVLYSRQTDAERSIQATVVNNGKGFTGADAMIGTSMAEFYNKFGRLSEKQVAYWRKPNVRGVPRICKYIGQLLEVANSRTA